MIRKCDQIVLSLLKSKSVIENLQEYKRAIITNAVIKGLDSTVKMADSGIEWIDSILAIGKLKDLYFCIY